MTRIFRHLFLVLFCGFFVQFAQAENQWGREVVVFTTADPVTGDVVTVTAAAHELLIKAGSAELDLMLQDGITILQDFGDGWVLVRTTTSAREAFQKLGMQFPTLLEQHFISLNLMFVCSVMQLASTQRAYGERGFAVVMPNDSLFSQQWNLQSGVGGTFWLDAIENVPFGRDRVVVGFVDSGYPLRKDSNLGVWVEHADFPRIASVKFAGAFDAQNGLNGQTGVEYMNDWYGHGTAVLSFFGATFNNGIGIAGASAHYPTSLVVAKSAPFLSDILLALKKVLDNPSGMHVLSMSMSTPAYSRALEEVIIEGRSRGVIFCFSAGNDGGPILYPARFSSQGVITTGGYPYNVVSVGMTAIDGTVSQFSNRGPEMTVVAPGVNVWAATPEYSFRLEGAGWTQRYSLVSGTSFSTPLVASLVAMIKSHYGSMTSAQKVWECLVNYCRKAGSVPYRNVGGRLFNDVYGYGIVDFRSSLRAAAGTTLVREPDKIPNAFVLANNPNPFTSWTVISYQVESSGPFSLTIYNNVGAQVRQLFKEGQIAGAYSILWDGRDDRGAMVPSGVYFCRLYGRDGFVVRKILFMK